MPREKIILTLRRPLRRKLRMRWFFDISKVKESSFFKSDLTDPPSDFWCASFGNYRFRPFQISFFSGLYIEIMFWVRWFYTLFERMRFKKKRTMFIHTNQPIITSFYVKNVPIFAELAMSQRWSAIFAQRAREGVNRSGAWGLINVIYELKRNKFETQTGETLKYSRKFKIRSSSDETKFLLISSDNVPKVFSSKSQIYLAPVNFAYK